jgi:hypothetical protein
LSRAVVLNSYDGREITAVGNQGPTDTASLEEFGHRADATYERYVKPNVSTGDAGKFVALDVSTGKYAIDADELAAEDRLLSVAPQASVWLTRVGSRSAHRLGRTVITG